MIIQGLLQAGDTPAIHNAFKFQPEFSFSTIPVGLSDSEALKTGALVGKAKDIATRIQRLSKNPADLTSALKVLQDALPTTGEAAPPTS